MDRTLIRKRIDEAIHAVTKALPPAWILSACRVLEVGERWAWAFAYGFDSVTDAEPPGLWTKIPREAHPDAWDMGVEFGKRFAAQKASG